LGKVKVESEKEKVGNSNSDRPFFLFPSSFYTCYGGLDMGDQCWFVARAVDAKAPHLVRLLWAEAISAERVRARVPELFRQLGLTALCVDAGPLRDTARDLVFELNEGTEATKLRGQLRSQIKFRNEGTEGTVARSATATLLKPTFHERTERWRNARAAAVEFTQREGAGLRHKIGRTVEGREYPLLAVNRDETIERVVQELLPPGVGDPRLLELPDGTAAAIPTQRFFLPKATDETRAVLDLYERHLLAGARRERANDGKSLRYLDKCENHFLLATAYAALAELLAPIGGEAVTSVPGFRALRMARAASRKNRSLVG
jgi:hypothetical protein